MSKNLFDKAYNPDVLSCLANLSSDEVFTPPKIVNLMLDTLPQELFTNPNTKFFDPGCKSGVFLREIAKRLIVGLKDQIPDLQQRIDHIFHNQLYAIAITELTSLLSRRSLYCSKYPTSEWSVSRFDNAEGNIRYKTIKHTFKNKKCIFCGASEEELGDINRKNLESHAYEFIHNDNIKEVYDMKFDVIIGNPPYQLKTAGDDNGAQARPIYNLFVEKAILLNPSYLVMITPSRWMTGGWNLDKYRVLLTKNNNIEELHDYPDASDCFPGVEIKGGVSFFKWNKNYHGDCKYVVHKGDKITSEKVRPMIIEGMDTVIRYNDALPIIKKVSKLSEKPFSNIVSPMKPFGLPTKYHGAERKSSDKTIKVYANHKIYYENFNLIPKNAEFIDSYKLIVPKAIGNGDPKTDRLKPLICEPGACCTETYIMIGPFSSKTECDNVFSYINTKFFHFMLTLHKDTQDCLKKTYSYIPTQDFSQSWSDNKLYDKYHLTKNERDYINDLVRDMED